MTDDGGSVVLYRTDDGAAEVALRAVGGTAWLAQGEMAALFATTPQNITLHIKAIYEEGELREAATCKDDLQVRLEGARQVARRMKLYNLDMILAVGYRIKSPRGTQFRQWATTTLREYLVKGFALNDERLKNPGAGGDTAWFDELLERIREIRASEKLFYQKVKDIYSKSTDHDPQSERAQLFFKTVQNKMLYAVTGMTAAEMVAARSDPDAPHMGLTTWKGAQVRKGDVVTAKNYLMQGELRALNRIVTMFLDMAEDTALQRQSMAMADWAARLDEFLRFAGRDVLDHAGRVSHDEAERLAHARYTTFDHARREAEGILAEQEAAREWVELRRLEVALTIRDTEKGGK
jgi:hypothetical protein